MDPKTKFTTGASQNKHTWLECSVHWGLPASRRFEWLPAGLAAANRSCRQRPAAQPPKCSSIRQHTVPSDGSPCCPSWSLASFVYSSYSLRCISRLNARDATPTSTVRDPLRDAPPFLLQYESKPVFTLTCTNRRDVKNLCPSRCLQVISMGRRSEKKRRRKHQRAIKAKYLRSRLREIPDYPPYVDFAWAEEMFEHLKFSDPDPNSVMRAFGGLLKIPNDVRPPLPFENTLVSSCLYPPLL